MPQTDKTKAFSYYLTECEKKGIASDLFDFDAEIDSSLTYSEMLTELDEKFFDRIPNEAEATLSEIKEQEEKFNALKREEQYQLNQNDLSLISFFKKPKIIGIIGDINSGKSMLIYFILEELNKKLSFDVYSYGLRLPFKETKTIYSLNEMEEIKNSLIVVDEVSNLFDLDNRKIKKQIENSLRLINHNNNIIILSGVPENFKKFISAKLELIMFKKVTLTDCINGSKIKNCLLNYQGEEKGSEILTIAQNEALVYNSDNINKWGKIHYSYMQKYDTKLKNRPIFKVKCAKNVPKNVLKTCQKRS